MAPKIFITGVTGYVAGDALYVLSQAHPEYEYAALVRTQEKGDVVKKAYPSIRIVLGGLDDDEILKQEAAKADVVLHAADASDHEGAAMAIAAGLVEGHTKENPGYWLHTGGTGILTYDDSNAGRLGEWSDKEYNDWEGVGELTGLPDEAFHRNVDKIVLEAGQNHGDVVKTALLCPPTIYGTGRGPVSGRSRQVYELTHLILSAKYVPVVGGGKARWNNLHVADLSKLFLLLTEAAVAKREDPELWGKRGYYIVEHGEHSWVDIARKIAKKAEELGYVGSLKEESLSQDAAFEQAGFQAVSWGLNSRAKGERAAKVLSWKPTAPSLDDELPTIIKSEHERLQNS